MIHTLCHSWRRQMKKLRVFGIVCRTSCVWSEGVGFGEQNIHLHQRAGAVVCDHLWHGQRKPRKLEIRS